jgi:hypothetical protein
LVRKHALYGRIEKDDRCRSIRRVVIIRQILEDLVSRCERLSSILRENGKLMA